MYKGGYQILDLTKDERLFIESGKEDVIIQEVSKSKIEWIKTILSLSKQKTLKPILAIIRNDEDEITMYSYMVTELTDSGSILLTSLNTDTKSNIGIEYNKLSDTITIVIHYL